MFGLDKDGNPTNDLLILDVADVNSISFLSTFPKINNSSTSNTNGTTSNGDNNSNTPKQEGGLSTGATIGIAVGCGAVVIETNCTSPEGIADRMFVYRVFSPSLRLFSSLESETRTTHKHLETTQKITQMKAPC